MAHQFAEPVVAFLLESISKLLIEEGKHLLGVSDKAQKLQSELRLMLSLVKSADQRQDEDAALKEWISQSKDLAYEAENVLETFAFRNASRNILQRSMCIFSECCMLHKVGSEIVAHIDKISNLTKRFNELGIRTILEKEGPSSRQQQLIRRTYSHVQEEDFVGLENDVNMLARALVKEYQVVSICGMGGLGKTTIARKVYNHPDVRRHFDHFGWVCISQQWQPRDILVRILVKLIPERKDDFEKCENVDRLVQELHQVQQNKVCLIVLDDIWSSNAWDCMKNAFPRRTNGSKILLTTRNKDVAIHIGPNGFHHEPRLLSQKESWELLQKKALEGQNFQVYGDIHKFEDLGNEMVAYCQGLPLAVVVLGGILASKHDFNEWEIVSKNVKSYLEKVEIVGEKTGEVQRILALSYNDLPYQLKPCFLYLGVFPEDSEIETETLYLLWMAEGMVSEADRIHGEESMMDIAERYLEELANRSMVQVVVKNGPGIRKFWFCRLHDLMRDLCLHKGREENFLKVIDYGSGDHNIGSTAFGNDSMGKIQRLVIFLNADDGSKYRPPKRQMVRHVRSFTFSVERGSEYRGSLAKTSFKNFKMLRALTVGNLMPYAHGWTPRDYMCSPLPTFDLPIGNLIHLRYLSLQDSPHLALPPSISKLQHLETLDLRNANILCLRDLVHRLRNLRHLYLPYGDHFIIPWRKLHLAGLRKLEILEGFSPKICHVKYLNKLTNLNVLSASIHRDDGLEVMKCISNLPQLKQVNLGIDDFDSSEGFELLFCSNLKHLDLYGKLNKLPEYRTDFLKCLIELELYWTELERDPMETLEKLPKLQSLWMKHDSFVGKEMTCHATGFPQLIFLEFDMLNKLEKWIIEEGAMPRLSRLHISKCSNLIVEMPPEFNNRVQVRIGGEGEDFDKVRIGGEGEDFDKVRHVASIVLR